MKKFKNLYQKITDLDNIKLAHHNARKNKTHRDDVKKVDADIEGFCKQMQDILVNHTYYKYYRRKMASYIGWFKHANCYSLLTKTIKHKELLDYLDIRKGNRTYA